MENMPKKRQEETLFDLLFNDYFNATKELQNVRGMKTDVVETEGSLKLEMELPGYKKENIDIDLVNGKLIICATNEVNSEDTEGNVIKRERSYGSTTRSFFVGNEVKPDNVKVNYNDGILKVVVQKVKTEPKKIIIE